MNTHQEKRGRMAPVPSHLDRYLTPDQLNTINYLEHYGWKLYFIRRPLNQQPTVIMINRDMGTVCLLEKEGHVDMHPTVTLRGQSMAVQ